MRILSLLLLAYQITTEINGLPTPDVGDEANWAVSCPHDCTCYMSTLTEMEEDTEKTEYIIKEDVAVTETPQAEEELPLKAAVCMINQRTNLKNLFSLLSPDTEMLTMIQSQESPDIRISRDHLSNMDNLRVLIIQGAHYQNFQEHGTFHIHGTEDLPKFLINWDAFTPLSTIEVIDIENAEIEPAPKDIDLSTVGIKKRKRNKKKREAPDDDILLVEETANKKIYVEDSGPVTILHELVFLPGQEESSKIVPYEVYKAEIGQQSTFESVFFLKNLRTIRLNRCKIPPLSGNTFAGLDNLRHVVIEYCDLKILPDLLFAKATNIESLILSNNEIIDLNSEAFAGLFELQHLDLSYNNLTHISETSFAPMPSLQFINLRGNSLRIFPSTFEVMNATRRIYLGDPHDSEATIEIIPGAFKGLRYLHHLSIHGLRTMFLDSELLRGTKTLSELVIEGQVHELAFDAFIHNQKLRKLNLSHCQIREISVDSFQNLHGLQVLDLSHNEIKELPPGIFDNLQSLKELWLTGNQLQELPENVFQGLHTKLIRLDGNPWHCTCNLKQLNPAVVSKVRTTKHPIVCDKAFDKPSLCHSAHILKYRYDKMVAPRCKTPARWEHWSVFDVLRKELKCEQRFPLTNRPNSVNFNYLNLKQLMRNFETYAEAHEDSSDEVEVTYLETHNEEDPEGGELIEDDEYYQPRHDDTFYEFNMEHPFTHLKQSGNSLVKSKLSMYRKLAPYEMENETINKEDLSKVIEEQVDNIVSAIQENDDFLPSDDDDEINDDYSIVETSVTDQPETVDDDINRVERKQKGQMEIITPSANELTKENTSEASASQTKVIRNSLVNDIFTILSSSFFPTVQELSDQTIKNKKEINESMGWKKNTEVRRTPKELLEDKEYVSKLSRKSLKLLKENAGIFP
ncbi:uncharacterized protein LOC136039314 [Artemia franciscana]|uniref:uncharacterized protein LOC136039314 n=1 Tax=Artemia franciscana TaxID=6661 RepID=UPI0032DB5F90